MEESAAADLLATPLAKMKAADEGEKGKERGRVTEWDESGLLKGWIKTI